MNSPKSNVSNCMSSSNNTNTPPLTPKTIPRSDNSNPYPTTFVQADTSTFKQVVQMLTGSSETTTTPKSSLSSSSSKQQPQHHHQQQQQDLVPSRNFNIPPIKTAPKKQGFKLYERRNSIKNSLMLNTIMPNFANNSVGFSSSPLKPEILSPSLLDFPSLVLSPVTPLNDDDPFDKSSSSPSLGNSSEEDKAIAQKGYYLHPSPITTPRDSEPQLLPLFPVSSPRVSESPS